ncbi:MAG: glycogen debranching protein GlgX [Candidatus Promineifilaceae bacterium]
MPQLRSPDIQIGRPHPLGATLSAAGVNFSLFSKNAAAVELLLFDSADDGRPARAIPLEANRHRTFYYWHAFVPGLRAGQLYGYRVHGPNDAGRGLRFDADKLLLDPYGRALALPRDFSRAAASRPGDNAAQAMKSVVADPALYDWEGDRPLGRPAAQTVIYELHVKGFTQHPSSGVPAERRGRFAGLIDKIPYLQELGVTAVELLPVFAFDAQDASAGLTNYWGYSPVSFFAPHPAYGSQASHLSALDEFRDLVKALHRAGIEVILDVVYNHTAEGGANGPTYSWRGLANTVYYLLQEDRAKYADYTGTGNTFNANNTIGRRLILDSLHYWRTEMHVDGFRFDLASVLTRDERGVPLPRPPVIWDIESDPRLAGVKLIAEAWDAAGLYQVGSFVGDRWNEWNGKFRDDVRAFLRGDTDTAERLPARLLASPDVYANDGREAEQSINFVTSHDGFTLNDLVSYSVKHNEANGEGNRDGFDHNLSANYGVEGPSDDPQIEAVRNRQVKNFLVLNLLSLGLPMLLMGDEVRRSQAGNNNAYCQDNEISWLDWRLGERYADIGRFTQKLIALRLRQDLFRVRPGLTLADFLHQARIHWHGTKLGAPDWGPNSHSLAATIECLNGRCLLHAIFNAYWEPLEFELPAHPWRRVQDTGLDAPDDICDPAEAPAHPGDRYPAAARTVVLLVADRSAKKPPEVP